MKDEFKFFNHVYAYNYTFDPTDEDYVLLTNYNNMRHPRCISISQGTNARCKNIAISTKFLCAIHNRNRNSPDSRYKRKELVFFSKSGDHSIMSEDNLKTALTKYNEAISFIDNLEGIGEEVAVLRAMLQDIMSKDYRRFENKVDNINKTVAQIYSTLESVEKILEKRRTTISLLEVYNFVTMIGTILNEELSDFVVRNRIIGRIAEVASKTGTRLSPNDRKVPVVTELMSNNTKELIPEYYVEEE